MGVGILGTSPVHFVKNSPFHRPSANVVVSVSGNFVLLDSPRVGELASSGATAQLSSDFYPVTDVEALATISTGRAPSEHGLINSANPRTHLAVDGIADVLSKEFNGESIIVSASSEPGNRFPFCPKGADSSSCVRVADSVARTSWEQLTEALGDFVAFDRETNQLVVTLETRSVRFSVHDSVVSPLLEEIKYLSVLPKTLREAMHSRTQDASPDFYSVSISSWRQVKNTLVGDRLVAATKLLDASIGAFFSSMSELYDNELVGELILFPDTYTQTASSVVAERLSHVEAAIYSILGSETLVLPMTPVSLSVDLGDELIEKLCSRLNEVVASEEFDIECIGYDSSISLLSIRELIRSTEKVEALAVEPTQVDEFQVVLWLSIILISTLFFAVWALANMENKRDTLLYSKFNPNWQHRKNQ